MRVNDLCGIVGLLNLIMPITQSDLHAMAGAIKQRGPDSDGFYIHRSIGLGIRRLSIIDLNTGDQPISNENGTVWTVFNGEIYNYLELKAELIRKGHVFKTQTDTEVLVHQYEEDGEACVEKFRGMFAFAIWDAGCQKLVLARDRFGIKPLFITMQEGRFGFASEMKALFQLNWVDLSWNLLALRVYLSLGYIPHPMTAYQGISKFPPGTVATWKADPSGKLFLTSSWEYWKPSSKQNLQKPPSFRDACASTLDLLKDSIKLHLQSDVPLGTFLSGGVDSTSVLALMRLVGVSDIKTFSIGFDNQKYNELPYAERIARHFQTDHYSHIITGAEAEGLLSAIEYFDEPFADSSAIPTYFVSHLAHQYVTVALSGDGGDEIFAGYDHYRRIEKYYLFDCIPDSVRRTFTNIAAVILPESRHGGGFVRRLGVKRGYRHLSFMSDNFSGYLRDALSVKFASCLDEAGDDAVWQSAYSCNDRAEAAQIIDQRTWMPNDGLTKVDRTSMMNSLEVRVPLLDHVLAEYVNGLPTKFKLDQHNSKRLLKQVIAPFIPAGVFERPKLGFGVPLRQWLTGALSRSMRELLLDNPMGLF